MLNHEYFIRLFFYYSVRIFFIYLYVTSVNVENIPRCVKKFFFFVHYFLQHVKLFKQCSGSFLSYRSRQVISSHILQFHFHVENI